MSLINIRFGFFGRILLLTYCVVSCNASAFASSTAEMQTDKRLVAYSKIKGTSSGKDELERIRSQGLAASPANLNLIREALASRASDDERAVQVAILGAMWARTGRSGVNDAIQSDLRKHAQSGDPGIARAAVFALSRMGGVADLREVLQHAKDHRQIDNDEYAGEVARNIRFIAKEKQSEYLALLERANSKYGIDVLTSDLISPTSLAQYDPDTLADIENLLGRSEPGFPFAIGEFGHIDAMRYTAWLEARAAISEKRGRGSRDAFVLNILNGPTLDPRKAIGYLSAPESAPFMRAVSRKKLEPVASRIRAFADSLPQNQVIREFAHQALLRISSTSF